MYIPAVEHIPELLKDETNNNLVLALTLFRVGHTLKLNEMETFAVFQVRTDIGMRWIKRWIEGGYDLLKDNVEFFEDQEYKDWKEYASNIDHPACWMRKTGMVLERSTTAGRLRTVLPFLRLMVKADLAKLCHAFWIDHQVGQQWVDASMQQFRLLKKPYEGSRPETSKPSTAKKQYKQSRQMRRSV